MTDKQPEALRLADRIDLKDYYEFDASLHCQKAAAELRRLHIVEKEFQQWITKTEWVQKSSQSHDLGIHRADVMKQRLDRLRDENEALRAALEQSQNHVPDAGNMAPAGWKLVPSDATHQWAENLADRGMRISSLASAISDMLAAAPHPPTVKECLTVEQQQGGQEPVALLADAIRSEPTELIHKWRVLELIQDHAKPQPKREPLTDKQIS